MRFIVNHSEIRRNPSAALPLREREGRDTRNETLMPDTIRRKERTGTTGIKCRRNKRRKKGEQEPDPPKLADTYNGLRGKVKGERMKG